MIDEISILKSTNASLLAQHVNNTLEREITTVKTVSNIFQIYLILSIKRIFEWSGILKIDLYSLTTRITLNSQTVHLFTGGLCISKI